ncbi:DUF4198 domain-containing protein [Pseudochryseolinea flava]|uniref:DUF4198 domain-containing protein n=1 Tax=Pseudochryseolinea flava TaxID=2059302 RepID=A0A364XZI9_9BACT|nr:DUF4198 domain-containing protein [Pseudochryseolinea flava]RAV99893.1 hypothetical protein DQQ10_17795 [Pseudochryseolinea flava]
MLSKISLALLVVALLDAPAFMPRIWVNASQYRVKPNEKVTFNVIHREKLTDVPHGITRSTFVKAAVQSVQGNTDLLPLLAPAEKDNFEVSFQKEGTFAVMMRANPSLLTLSADSINAYVKEFDLEDVAYGRSTKNLLDKAARVTTSWHSTVLLQVGAATDDTFQNSSGYPLEIVPAKNPYDMKVGEKMKFTILWNGQPLFGARVIVRVTADNNTGVQHIYSGKDGVIEAPLGSEGTWVVMVSKMIASRNAEADWQSYLASLSFGH